MTVLSERTGSSSLEFSSVQFIFVAFYTALKCLACVHWVARLHVQEISANAHETRDSISLISYAGCLGIFQRKFTLSVRRSLK